MKNKTIFDDIGIEFPMVKYVKEETISQNLVGYTAEETREIMDLILERIGNSIHRIGMSNKDIHMPKGEILSPDR